MRLKWILIVAASALALPVALIAAGMLYDLEHWREYAAARDCERIRIGMSREQVDELLGSHGEVTKNILGFPPYAHVPGAPPGWNGCVWGDTFVLWEFGSAEIFVGFSEGRVTSKYFNMPSL
jgi:hypothetical protein